MGDVVQRQQINRMTPNRSERLYLRAQDKWGAEALKEVSLHTTTELYVMFEILKRPDPKADKSKPPKRQETDDDAVHHENAGDSTAQDGKKTNATVTGDGDDNVLPFPNKGGKNDPTSEPTEAEEKQADNKAPSKKKHEFAFSAEALTTVSLREPDYFELHVEDAVNGDVVLLLYRKQVQNLPSQIEKAMDEDDECSPDELPNAEINWRAEWTTRCQC